jgi:hypothetical protein
MESFFVLLLALGTSGAALLLGRFWLRLPLGGLRGAAARLLACLGLTAAFFAANLLLGMGVVLLGRLLLRDFVSLYFANDVSLLVLSLFQAFLVQRWRESG